jgi:glycosyltransferase involved in cell wall biosynthesis
MAPKYAVSVVLSTHNRAPLLGPAISRLLDQTPTSPDYEIIVVDNNSTDDTRAVVEEYARHATRPIRYIFEGRQGLSYARNAGIAAALAPIVAFTDDDVRVSRDWVEVIRNTFDQHPDVSCLGGRTLPVWPSRPPRWLTPLHWVGPLALQDYGERSFIVDSRRPVCLAGANFAFRKTVFDRVGLFSTDFPRAQDTEFLLRMYRAKERSLYVPRMRADATVDPGRLTKAYHRRWHLNIGRCNARMGFEELADPLLGLRESAPDFARVFGVPVFAFRQLGRELCAWVWMSMRGRPGEAFLHETRMRSLAGYILESRAIRRRESGAVGAAPTPKEERAVAHARSEV